MNRRALLASLGLSALALGSLRLAAAAPGAHPSLEVSVIHATKTDGGGSIDPALKDLPQLTRDQPFVQHNTFKLLDRQSFALQSPDAGPKPIVMPLPDGKSLEVVLDSVSLDKNEKRYQLQAQILEPGKPAVLKFHVTASETEPFFVRWQSYKGGKLYLELLIKP